MPKTIQEQLEIYQKALVNYQEELKQGNLSNDYTYNCGLCNYFKIKEKLYSEKILEEFLPILGSLKPSKTYDNVYWFHCGHLPPRINILKQAIEICKAKLRNN